MKYVILLVFLSARIMAQEGSFYCPSDSLYKEELKRNSTLRLQVQEFEESWKKDQVGRILQKALFGTVALDYSPPYHYNTNKNKVYTLPVVFHIIHPGNKPGEPYHKTDKEIKDALAYVNEVYAGIRNNMPGARAEGVYIPVQFVLAQRDENGNPTTGIVHVDGSVLPNYVAKGMRANDTEEGVSEEQINSLSRWDPDMYLNIYVVNKLNGAAGYAYIASNKGLYMDTAYMSSSYTTFPHELGHVLNLFHVFQGGNKDKCPSNNNCLKDNDNVCDTEPTKLLRYSTMPSGNDINPCTNKMYDGGPYNLMNYTWYYRNRFTEGQTDRMVLDLESDGLKFNMINFHKTYLPLENQLPVRQAQCTPPSIQEVNSTYNIGNFNVKMGSFHYISSGYDVGNDSRYYVDYTRSKNSSFIRGKEYEIKVSVKYHRQHVYIFIDYNDDGDFDDLGEQIFFGDIGESQQISHRITIPLYAVRNKPLRMRISGEWYARSQPPYNPRCAKHIYGQTKDFAVTIVDPALPEDSLPKIGINTTTPETTLEIDSPNKGVVFPKMTNTQMWNIKKPSTGMLIYNITEHCLAMNYGTEEQPLWRCFKTREMN